MTTDKKLGRNALCPCGSGKKHKLCCLRTVHPVTLAPTPAEVDLQAAKAAAYDCLAQAQEWQQRAHLANERVAKLAGQMKA